MLHRELDNGYLIISQPAHAWVSGQLAAAWGNDLTGDIASRAELVLAAEQHDIGWLDWEAAPTLNPETGRPRTFMQLPTSEHLSVWAPAGPRALVYGPYVAMLVSMHGTGLYARHDYSRDSEQEAEAARAFVAEGARFEDTLRHHLHADPAYAHLADDETIARNRRLVAVMDAISLFLCGGLTGAREIQDVPAAASSISLQLTPDPSTPDQITVGPWPFTKDSVRLRCAGRVMTDTFHDEKEMRRAVAGAPWRTLEIVLSRNSVN